MKMVKFVILILLGMSLFKSANGQTESDEQLKTMILNNSDSISAHNAIAMALKEDKPDILTTGVDSPDWGVKTSAIEAIAKLTPKETAQAIIQILKKDQLWAARPEGGRGEIIADNFAQTFKAMILKAFGVDVSSTDLFDNNTRTQLIASLVEKR